MAYIRKLPSGKWQATVRGPRTPSNPSGRYTKTDRLKGVVTRWATEKEDEANKDSWSDPALNKITFGEWRTRWWDARVVDEETRRANASRMRVHIASYWDHLPIRSIKRMDVQKWVKKMREGGAGAAVTVSAYILFAQIMGDAVTDGILAATPCRDIDLPQVPKKPPRWLTRAQVDVLVEFLPPGHATMTELMVTSGLRWGEAAGLRVGDVDIKRARLWVIGKADRFGVWKEYPKTSASRDEVPIEPHVVSLLRPLVLRPADQRVFLSVRGKRLHMENWRRTWQRALERANDAIADRNTGRAEDDKTALIDPEMDPHDCRHTAASWLVQEGVPIYNIKGLLRHESIKTTEKYAHLQPGAHGAIEAAWGTLMTHERRTKREIQAID